MPLPPQATSVSKWSVKLMKLLNAPLLSTILNEMMTGDNFGSNRSEIYYEKRLVHSDLNLGLGLGAKQCSRSSRART
eukprot:341919-Amphidinium_carterae.1